VALAHRLRSVGTRPSVRRALNGLGAVLFAGLAARLALAQR
jgi:threonine/homoserine/homoserine lactone efflux protein